MTKKFTLLQLFSIIDGRLSTEIGDVYEMLNHITGENLYTHHLPVAMKYIEEVSPLWFFELKEHLNEIKKIHGDDFNVLIKEIKQNYNTEFDIPQLRETDKNDFESYMIDNSLLLNR